MFLACVLLRTEAHPKAQTGSCRPMWLSGMVPLSIHRTPSTPGMPATASIASTGQARGLGEAHIPLWLEFMAVTGTGQPPVPALRSRYQAPGFQADGLVVLRGAQRGRASHAASTGHIVGAKRCRLAPELGTMVAPASFFLKDKIRIHWGYSSARFETDI